MAKSRRILSVLLAILMVLTIVPAGLIGTAGAFRMMRSAHRRLSLVRASLRGPILQSAQRQSFVQPTQQNHRLPAQLL